jgi:hypothetical protein
MATSFVVSPHQNTAPRARHSAGLYGVQTCYSRLDDMAAIRMELSITGNAHPSLADRDKKCSRGIDSLTSKSSSTDAS